MRPTLRSPAGAAVLLALVLQAGAARSASVSGAFVEKGAGTPLAAVDVALRRAADSTVVAHAVTAADGRFRLDSLQAGRYLLRASLLGYQPYARSDLVLGATESELDLGTNALTVSPIAIPGSTVTTTRAPAIVAPDRNIYLAKDLPSATSGTATDILRTVPELDVDLEGRVSLRGSTSVNIQFNGRAAPMKGEALTTFLRQMPAGRIERVEVIASPSARFDPEGTAGIVNIVLKDKLEMGLTGSVTLTAGQRYNSPGARVAWQRGPLTMFGGLAGSVFRWTSVTSNERRSLLTTPASTLLWNTDRTFEGRYGMLDASVDYAISGRSTLYGTVSGIPNAYDPVGLTHYARFDSTQSVTSLYSRDEAGRWSSRTASFTLGFQNVIQAGKHERSIEYMQSGTSGDNRNRGLEVTEVPAGTAGQLSQLAGATGYHERSLQLDDTHPLGERGKVELGYRGAERRNTNSSELRYFVDGLPVANPAGDASDFAYREVFHSGYVTLGSTFGRLSLQGGARAEWASTSLDVRSIGERFDKDYRSLFPSANVAWDFGRGRTARFTYSKRIERPSAYYLNPDVPATDSLNRFVGNPDLGPRHTHSFGIEASWTGSRGVLRLAPFLRETVDNWDVVTRVDAAGVATSTYLNASSVRMLGANLTASMRQTGRLGGTLTWGVSRERHDASNLSSQYRRDVTGWSANGNLTFKTTGSLDLQGYLRYAPARALAQGRSSSYIGSTLGARLKLRENASASLTVNDPFRLSRYSSSTGDATYTQSSATDNRMRSVSGSFTWTWGKIPEQKQRRQSASPGVQDAPGQER